MKIMNVVLVFSLFILVGCATEPPAKPLPAGTPNTFTYKNEQGQPETVYDLSGQWKLNSGGAIIKIEQDGVTVKGFWVKPIPECYGKWFNGKIKGDKVSGTRYVCPSGFDSLIMEINSNAAELLIYTTVGKYKLTRTN